MIVEPQKSVENEGSQKVQVLRKGVCSEEWNAEVLLRGVPDEGEGGQEEEAAGFYECCGACHWVAESGVPDVCQGCDTDGMLAAVCV